MVTNEIDGLLARYFAGELSSQDELTLNNWLAESEKNETYFFELTSVYQNIAGVRYPDFDVEEAQKSFKNYVEGKKQNTIIPKKKNKILLWAISAAAAVATLWVISNIWGDYTNIIDNGTYMADNTKMTLMNGELRLSKDIGNDTIYLTGTASFEMDSEKDGNKVVKTGEVFIKDIGTSFTVDANNPDSIHVHVDEGQVLFYSDTDSGIDLKKNESGYYISKNKQFYKIKARGDFNFQETSLNRIVSQLNMFYGDQVALKDENLKQLSINVNFQNEELATILDIISITLNVKVEYANNKYIIDNY